MNINYQQNWKLNRFDLKLLICCFKTAVQNAAEKYLKSVQSTDVKGDKLQEELRIAFEPPINKLFSRIGQTRFVWFFVDFLTTNQKILQNLKIHLMIFLGEV